MKQNANQGLSKVYWAMGIVLIVGAVAGTIFWWIDGLYLK